MKGTDRTILIVLPLIALAIGFYLLVLAPKQREAGELQDRIDSLNAEVAAAQSDIDVAETARDAFPRNYADLVKLGTAVPEDDDQATLIHDLNRIGAENDLNFQSFEIAADSATASAPPATEPTTTDTSTDTSTETTTDGAESSTTTDTTTVAASSAPTEAVAATLPIGATVGPAGLPVTPYTLEYFGRFFDMAGLFGSLDDRVDVNGSGMQPVSHGRLMTIDGFSMTADPVAGFPSVATEIAVTTYMVPADQGIAAGATPAGPAPLGSPQAPVAVAEAGTPTSTPTAAVTP